MLPLNEITVWKVQRRMAAFIAYNLYPITSNQKQGFPAFETIQACGIFHKAQVSHLSAERGA